MPEGKSATMPIPGHDLVIAPSILASNWLHLADEVARAEDAGADWLHLDVMDGHFVDNISFGPEFCAFVSMVAKVPLDVHLMISRPDHYLERFSGLAHNVSVHVEADHDVGETLKRLRDQETHAGLAINPPTDFAEVEPYLDRIDLLLVMTVNPGFGGQSFLGECLDKVVRARELREKHGWNFRIEVDGGIGQETAMQSIRAGADTLVAGSSTFKANDMAAAVRALRADG